MPGTQGANVIDFGSYMSIFLLDSSHTHPVGGTQTAWLAQALRERKEIPNKFAIYHVPAYPSVHSLSEEVGTEIRKCWVPLFEKYNLTAAFENHEHTYKRTYPLINGKIVEKGVIYIGDGSWAVEKPRRLRRRNNKWYLIKAETTRNFLHVTVTPEGRTVKAINPDTGDMIDTVSW